MFLTKNQAGNGHIKGAREGAAIAHAIAFGGDNEGSLKNGQDCGLEADHIVRAGCVRSQQIGTGTTVHQGRSNASQAKQIIEVIPVDEPGGRIGINGCGGPIGSGTVHRGKD